MPRPKKEPGGRINLRIEKGPYEALKQISDAAGTTPAMVVRELIEMVVLAGPLYRQLHESVQNANRVMARSALQEISQIAGRIEAEAHQEVEKQLAKREGQAQSQSGGKEDL